MASLDDLKIKITEYLKNYPYGTSIKKIATSLNKSRTTIAKYLKELEDEGKVSPKEVGIYSLWVLTESQSSYQTNPFRILSLEVYKNLMRNLVTLYPTILEQGNELGRMIAPNLNVEAVLEQSEIRINELRNILKSEKQILKMAVEFLLSMNLIGDTYTIEPTIIDSESHVAYLTLKKSQFLDAPLHFKIVCGILEKKLEDNGIKIKITIHEINRKDEFITLKFSLN